MGLLDIFKRRGAPLPAEGGPFGVLSFLGLWQNPRVDRLTEPEEQLAAYRGWVYAAVRRIAEDLRAAPWSLVDADGTSITTGPLVQILSSPYQLYTFGDMIEAFYLYHDLTGHSFIYVVTDERGRVIGFHPLSPRYVQGPIIEGGRFLGWRVLIGGGLRDIAARELPWSRYPHPLDPWRGASPVEAFAASYELDLYARAYGADMVSNEAGIPAGILSTDQLLDDVTAERIREQWRQRHAERWGEEGPAVLGAGAKYQTIGIPLSDLKFLELAQISMDQILAIYGVPASKLGLVKDVNRANAEANDRTYRANVLRPRLARFAELVNLRILREFWPAEYKRGVRFRFADIVGEDPALRFQKVLHGWKSGAVLRNEYRAEAGLEPLEEDGLLVPAGMELVPADGGTAGRSAAQAADIVLRATEKDLELAALRFLRDQEPLERSLKSQIRGIFSTEQREVIKAWKIAGAALEQRADEGDAILQAFLRAVRAILRAIAPRWAEALERSIFEGVRRGWDQAFDDPPAWSDFEPNAVAFAERQAGIKIAGISDTTLEELRRVVAGGLREGKSIDEIQREIAGLYDRWKGYRAERIARTETATAVNWGKHKAAEELQRTLGRPVVKVWSAILDSRVRADHAAVHGQRAKLDEPFLVGGSYLMHPGDPDGPAGEVINCRCSTYYEVADEREGE